MTPQRATLPGDSPASFAPTTSVRCVSSARLEVVSSPCSLRLGVQRCLALHRCVAVEHYLPSATCTLFSECLHRKLAHNYTVAHYQPQPWPSPAARVHWQTGVAVVVASYNRNISRIAELLASFSLSADLVVYHKHDFNGSRGVTGGWRRHLGSECLGAYLPLLTYLQVLPNFGTTLQTAPHKAPGGSREPYAYLQFLLDFYDNLPQLILFTQDDNRGNGMFFLRTLHERHEQFTAPLLTSVLERTNANAMATFASVARRPDAASCLCVLVRNRHFNRTGFYPIVAGLRRQLFLASSTSVHDPTGPPHELTYPSSARFGVGKASVLARPRWVYTMLARLTTAEMIWPATPTLYMANVLERFWLVLFDTALEPRTLHERDRELVQARSATAAYGLPACPCPWVAAEAQAACEAFGAAGADHSARSREPRFERLVACTQLAWRWRPCAGEEAQSTDCYQ